MLVVGFGNSGGEIALDLANAGVDVALAVRSSVQILPRDLLGFPILTWAILYRRLPARLVDMINAPILRLAVGRIEDLGLRRAEPADRFATRLAMTVNPFLREAWHRAETNSFAFPDEPNAP